MYLSQVGNGYLSQVGNGYLLEQSVFSSPLLASSPIIALLDQGSSYFAPILREIALQAAIIRKVHICQNQVFNGSKHSTGKYTEDV